jgi:hypothetical protein
VQKSYDENRTKDVIQKARRTGESLGVEGNKSTTDLEAPGDPQKSLPFARHRAEAESAQCTVEGLGRQTQRCSVFRNKFDVSPAVMRAADRAASSIPSL